MDKTSEDMSPDMNEDEESDAEAEGLDDDDDKSPASIPFASAASQKMLMVDQTAVFLVYIVNFLDSLGGSISTPILPFYAAEFNANYTQVGYLFSTFALAQVISMPFLSYMSDRKGRKKVLLLATLGTGVGALWQGTATSYNSLLCSRIFSGLWAGVASVCQVYIVDVTPPDLRADYLSYLNSSTQASTLFGPSIGAGLSALGINVPVKVQGCVSFVLCIIIWAHLTESPEWCRLNAPDSPMVSPMGQRSKLRQKKTVAAGMGRTNIAYIIISYGALSLCGMVAQMSIMSMFALYAGQVYGLNSVEVGFTMTLGAISSVATNIWVSAPLLRRLGTLNASLFGFALILVGSLCITLQPYKLSVVGLMIAYQGLAINSSAVATGAANRTDQESRATIMTGTRMFKSAGAVIGPIVSGPLASYNVRWPFYAASAFSAIGMSTQLVSLPKMREVKALLERRKTVGKATPFLDGEWMDEYGTHEEIQQLGIFVADLLTKRHYRWVTYNHELKHFMQDSFPSVSNESEEKHRRDYDRRRQLAREQKTGDIQTIIDQNRRLISENGELQRKVKVMQCRLGEREFDKNQDADRKLNQIQFSERIHGFG